MSLQNIDLVEISLMDVSLCSDSVATSCRADTSTASAQVRWLSEMILLDSPARLLNPKWYEGMLDSAYEGVREVACRLNFPLG